VKSSPSDLFAGFALREKSKLVVLGSSDSFSETMVDLFRSLTFIEHVSLASLTRPEISRHGSLRLAASDNAAFGLVRKWFWSRKPDAGFVLWDFPATLLQALMLDEWLDVRQENLDAVFQIEGISLLTPLSTHYCNHGLLQQTNDIASVS